MPVQYLLYYLFQGTCWTHANREPISLAIAFRLLFLDSMGSKHPTAVRNQIRSSVKLSLSNFAQMTPYIVKFFERCSAHFVCIVFCAFCIISVNIIICEYHIRQWRPWHFNFGSCDVVIPMIPHKNSHTPVQPRAWWFATCLSFGRFRSLQKLRRSPKASKGARETHMGSVWNCMIKHSVLYGFKKTTFWRVFLSQSIFSLLPSISIISMNHYRTL